LHWLPFRDALPVATLPFVLGGLSVFHSIVARHKYLVWVLFLLYGLFFVCWPCFFILMALTGWVNVWYDLRLYGHLMLTRWKS